ncbi:MAG TPA: GerMN domain-containing protein [Verrucomicrobiae bacterium]|nr:GerMN domain-containing protein [Verrucomicrobiae bacterium]
MKRLLTAILLIFLITLTQTGCVSAPNQGNNSAPEQNTPRTEPEESQQPANPTGPGVTEKMVSVTLYYPDAQSQFLVKVNKQIKVTNGAVIRAIVTELQTGDAEHNRTIPKEARLLGATVKDNIAYLDFSQEFKLKHWGGSTGESMTIYSIVNSLTELPNIKGVAFYLDGKLEGSILGHADWSKPFLRNEQLIRQ